MNKYLILSMSIILISCAEKPDTHQASELIKSKEVNQTSIVILGTAQDAGSPQMGCKKDCCAMLFKNPDSNRKVISLGLIDPEDETTYLFEATPDIGAQMHTITQFERMSDKALVDGIFLTHAHIGHYTGLMYLGKEAVDAKNMPVYVMPRMKKFLNENGPWNQLVARENIALQDMEDGQPIRVSKSIVVTPFLVPHRDEYSETVGFKIQGPNKSALFIPDIDKWEKWEKNIVDEIRTVDYAFLDAAFYDEKEINNRDISEIPHPFVIESFKTFEGLSKEERGKVIFIHFNHTNPLLRTDTNESQQVIEKGYKVGKVNEVFEL